MAVCKDAIAFDVTAQKAAEMELTFNCKPQRWSVEGQRTIVLDGRTTLRNPFSFPAQPIFKVYGDSGGVLYVGEQKITIHSIQDYDCSNCETHNAYNASGFAMRPSFRMISQNCRGKNADCMDRRYPDSGSHSTLVNALRGGTAGDSMFI